jgi:hypothetical protein
MPITPEELRQYTKPSAELQCLGHSFSRDLPVGSASLHLHTIEGKSYLDAYDGTGKIIATLRADQMPQPLRDPIERLALQPYPDPDGIICPL